MIVISLGKVIDIVEYVYKCGGEKWNRGWVKIGIKYNIIGVVWYNEYKLSFLLMIWNLILFLCEKNIVKKGKRENKFCFKVDYIFDYLFVFKS